MPRRRWLRRHGKCIDPSSQFLRCAKSLLPQDGVLREFMSILIDKSTRVIVQGLTGREGTFHAKTCAEYGTKIVGGVTPGKGGTTHEGWPVFNTVQQADRK